MKERRRKVDVEEDEKEKEHGGKKVNGEVNAEAAERSGREVNILTACVAWKSHRGAATLKKGKSEGRKRGKVSQLIRKTKRREGEEKLMRCRNSWKDRRNVLRVARSSWM